jgi:hypothetical protein
VRKNADAKASATLTLAKARGRRVGSGFLYDAKKDPTRLASLATLPFQGRDKQGRTPN